jgi:glutamine cyclotransferase
MRRDYLKFFVGISVVSILIWTISCSGRPGVPEERKAVEAAVANEERPPVKLVSPEENTGFRLLEPVKVVLEAEKGRVPDSVIITFDSRRVASIKSAPWEYTIPAEFTSTTGRKSLKITSFEGQKPVRSSTRFMIVYSDVVPAEYGYKVIHTYPHDREAFTQGLFYYEGVLYEGTGQPTASNLREVELETGKVLRQHNLDGSLFGEGITLYKDRIFQVTWENKVGFVYDRATFKQLNKLYYATQGWGLTTVKDRIVMSDGTNVLYFYEPETFTVLSRLEVYDNKTMVDSLNELEFINGEIWANIWMTDRIARIDPESGKIKGYIELKGLLSNSDKTPETDVLNGIAWDAARGRIFVTGKRWPKLFEIKVIQ